MRRFIVMRIFQSLVALLLFSMVVFGLVRLGGDPALRFMSSDSTEEEYKYFRSQLGLDEPIYVQYGIFLTDVVRGDFGTSIFTKRRVIDSIKEMLPNSLRLIAASALIAFIIAVPLGVMAAVRKKTLVDTLARVIAGLGQSFPSFWIGLMMIQVFAVKLGVLPTSGMGSWKHYLMPASCLALFLIPGPIRLLRSSMLESLDSEYIRLARIKGVSERLTIWKHAFRNSLLPVLSFSAMYIAILVTGCIVIETVFAWSGMGRLCYRAIISQDFPLIQGVVMTTAVIVIAANLIVDILYGYLDPRIRLKV
jgi:peptide/nickel transport system permease protein